MLGHAYTTPRPKPVNSGTVGSTTAPQSSNAGSPPGDSQSVSSLPRLRAASNGGGGGEEARETSLLAQSLSLLQRYGDEYMDEMPLVGEPGSFIMQRAKDGAKVSVRASAQKGSGESAEKGEENGDASSGAGPVRGAAPSPPPIKTDLASEVHKRVKGAEKSPLTPGGGKKRKKSKIQTPKTPK